MSDTCRNFDVKAHGEISFPFRSFYFETFQQMRWKYSYFTSSIHAEEFSFSENVKRKAHVQHPIPFFDVTLIDEAVFYNFFSRVR